MIRHVVTFKLLTQEGQDRAAAAARLRDTLEPLREQIPGVQSLEVGIDDQSVPGHWDAVLISEHDSMDALAQYQRHPDHQQALAVVAELVEAKSVVDYEVR